MRARNMARASCSAPGQPRGPRIVTMLRAALVTALVLCCVAHTCAAYTCSISARLSLCDGKSDDTNTLQRALDECSQQGISVVVHSGARCVSQPLQLRSSTDLVVASNATILAGTPWPHLLRGDGKITPFLLGEGVVNVTVRGEGTLDGNGALWWHKADHRPRLLVFLRAQGIRVEGVTLRNSAFWTLLLHGRDFTVAGIKVRAPLTHIAPNTDGIDVAADNVHIHDVDIINGDDSICIKSPSSNVLVERSTVAQGNGLVVGTAANQDIWGGPSLFSVANVSNVTFRDITADDTTFGCHIKYYFPQRGHVRNITFANITVRQTAAAEARRVARNDWAGYAIGLHQFDQGRRDAVGEPLVGNNDPTIPTFVSIEDIKFINITGVVQHAGQFECSKLSHWLSPCKGVRLEHVHLDLNASVGACVFSEVDVTTLDVSPLSCIP